MPKDDGVHNYFFGGLPEMPWKKGKDKMNVIINPAYSTEKRFDGAERVYIIINNKQYDLWEKDGQLIITVWDKLSLFPRSSNSVAIEMIGNEPND